MQRILHHHDGSHRSINLGGWRRQNSDARDTDYSLKIPTGFMATPTKWDNRPICSGVVDQGSLGACTANAFGGCIEANEIKRLATLVGGRGTWEAVLATVAPLVNISGITQLPSGVITFQTSVTPVVPAPTPTPPAPTPAPTPTPKALIRAGRLQHYYGTRLIEGTTSEDAGASIRDTAKTGYTYGVADESLWAYDVSKFAVRPPQASWDNAATHKVTSYHAIADGDLATMKATLAGGNLIEFGFNVYDFMMSAEMSKKGFLPLPKSSESRQGGHAVDLVGYDDTIVNPYDASSKGAFIVRNSWGLDWALQGYFLMSYDYVKSTKLCSDFWTFVSSPI